MNHDGSARYSGKSWPAGNMGGNAGILLVPIGMEKFFCYCVSFADGKKLGGTADIPPQAWGGFLFFRRRFCSTDIPK